MNNCILIIAFKYPPYPGVGAFRWANLSYEFAQAGKTVHVITVRWKRKPNSSFLHVLDHPNIIVHRLPSLGFHNIRNMEGRTRVGKYFAKAIKWGLRRVLKPWYFLDEAQQWHWIMIPYVQRLIQRENIHVMIATGTPYSVNYAAVRIKQILEQKGHSIKLTQDMRDPWNDLPNYPLSFGSCRRRNQSIAMEKFALDTANCVVTVTKGVAASFRKRTHTPIYVIYNGYPGKAISKTASKPTGKISAIYAGGFAHGRDVALYFFLDYLRKAELITRFNLTVYSSSVKKLHWLLHEHQLDQYIEFRDPIPYDQLLLRIPEYDYGLHLNGKDSKDALSTKIFDYLSVGVPVLSVNYGDEIHSFIQENAFGISLSLNNLENTGQLKKLFNEQYVPDMKRVKDFSYEQLAKTYVQLIESE